MHTDAVTRHLTIPNQLTILRILLVPVIGAVLVIDFNDHYQISAAHMSPPRRPTRSTGGSPGAATS